jgi:hypothetical protein
MEAEPGEWRFIAFFDHQRGPTLTRNAPVTVTGAKTGSGAARGSANWR